MRIFKKLDLNCIQESRVNRLINEYCIGDFQRTCKIGNEIATFIHNNINKDFDRELDQFFYIDIKYNLTVTNRAQTSQLFFRPKALELFKNNSIRVASVEFIEYNKSQIKKF